MEQVDKVKMNIDGAYMLMYTYNTMCKHVNLHPYPTNYRGDMATQM